MARRHAKRKIANTPADPTSAGVPITLAGNTYTLCFDLASLADAEQHFSAQGHVVNLLVALPQLNINTVRVVFPCAVHKHHPGLTFEAAQSLVTFETVWQIANKIAEAWNKAAPEPAADAPKKESTQNPPPA